MSDFAYHNVNPNREETEDCVCRAISLGTKLSYHSVKKLLEIVANYYGCDTLCVCCYHHLLEDIFQFPVKHSRFTESVGDVAKRHRYNTCLIRIDGHLTVSVMGVVFDIWDCTDKPVDCYWIVS